ncbi:DUF2017 family protein [Leucobacter sp. UCMA 4100]|uniref:DUF2017 family protein n=1 Tax=Leucobacter sp. UCMA 4100 TaxID=2810534 RepID=UPI0022EB0CC8|nr:DUF2017 family protein [Leucobacter sp. UCMA 4100]MDA3145981.1 DUF2017 family protein [Leucobacter sp. UCMA 4100]
MKILVMQVGEITIELHPQESIILSNLVGQLLGLLQSHSSTPLDPDPLLASYEIGGTDCLPADPALAKLLPNAYLDPSLAAEFRQVTEQGLLNRKIEDALLVATALSGGVPEHIELEELLACEDPEGTIFFLTADTLEPWVRTLTALRLSIAARLGIETEQEYSQLREQSEHEETFVIYEWLATLTDMLLRFAPALESFSDEEE